MEKYWLKKKERTMNLRSSLNSRLAANKNEGARMSKRTSSLIVGVVALGLVMVTLVAALSIIGTRATERIPPNEALIRSVALTGQNPAGYVAASGPAIGQSVFPGEAVARSSALTSQPLGEAFVRSVALTGQNPVGYLAASGPEIGQSVFPGEALARSMALTGQTWADYMVANEPKAPVTVP